MNKDDLKLIKNESLKKLLIKNSFQTNPILKKFINFRFSSSSKKFSIKDLFR